MPGYRATSRAGAREIAGWDATVGIRQAPPREYRYSAQQTSPAQSAPWGTARQNHLPSPAGAYRGGVAEAAALGGRPPRCTIGWASPIRRDGFWSACS